MTLIERLVMTVSREKASRSVFAPTALLAAAMLLSGCSVSTKTTSTAAQSNDPQTYMAPFIVGDTAPGSSVSAYQIDDSAQTFSKSTYVLSHVQTGERTYFAGATTALARGLLSLGLTYSWNSNGVAPTTYSTTKTLCIPANASATQCSWAVELPNQAGGLIAINGQPVEPLAPATSCPVSTTQTYQFLTLPAPLLAAGTGQNEWNPTLETGFGSVDVTGSGSAITFNNIQQYTLPLSVANGGTGASEAPATAVTSPQTGACSSTYYGNTTVVPASMTVTDPGNGSPAPPQTAVAIGPTGLLIESNNANQGTSSTALPYQNLLGAGTGAIGLPKPSSALDTSALIGAQYLGFFYESGMEGGSGSNGPSTLVASFGFATLPTNCKSVATQTSTMIYGGDFTKNNPGLASTQTAGGFGKCDVAIDLGTQDPKNNGLYPAAKVYIGTAYQGNGLGAKYNFPAVAIAGQLNGKYTIFLLGADYKGSPNQAWEIYLLQSN
jgi:hypothetical protein